MQFAAIADYSVKDGDERHVAKLVAKWKPDFILTLGDNDHPSGLASTIDDNIGRLFGAFIAAYRGRHGSGAPANRFCASVVDHDWYALPSGSM